MLQAARARWDAQHEGAATSDELTARIAEGARGRSLHCPKCHCDHSGGARHLEVAVAVARQARGIGWGRARRATAAAVATGTTRAAGTARATGTTRAAGTTRATGTTRAAGTTRAGRAGLRGLVGTRARRSGSDPTARWSSVAELAIERRNPEGAAIRIRHYAVAIVQAELLGVELTRSRARGLGAVCLARIGAPAAPSGAADTTAAAAACGAAGVATGGPAACGASRTATGRGATRSAGCAPAASAETRILCWVSPGAIVRAACRQQENHPTHPKPACRHPVIIPLSNAFLPSLDYPRDMLRASTRATLAAHMRDIRMIFADALATRLGRSAEEIRDVGLAAGDFRVDESVALTLPDGSSMSFRYAFVVVDSEQRIAGVFSEHCGYYCFGLTDLRIEELRDGELVACREG